MNVMNEETEYLEETLSTIDKEIEKAEKELDKLIQDGKKLSGEDKKRGEHLNINSVASNISEKIEKYKRSKPIPYFGRIDVDFHDKKTNNGKLYIGKSGVFSDGETVVTDWRAPVSTLYYDSEIGECSYNVPDGYGNIECTLNLKRQITIENSKLIDVQDTSLVSNDELLKPYLSINADNKMKTIVASIQQEQNGIIREEPFSSIIIQGVAGSGKTSVALHRIAYLVYTLGNRISSEEFLVLGPNDYFLNYISSILPDLETNPVTQKTFQNFAQNYIEEKITLREEYSNSENSDIRKIQAFKSSLKFKQLLDEFMELYIKENIVPKDFVIMNDIVFTKTEVMKALFALKSNFASYDHGFLILSSKLKNNLSEKYDQINQKYRSRYIKMDTSDPERAKLVAYSNELYKTMKNDGLKLLKKYFKEIQLSILNIYAMFIMYLNDLEIDLTDEQKTLMQNETLTDIKKKKLGFEDLPALMEIKYRLTKKTYDFKQIVIDEAQDYGLFHFSVLKDINPNSYFAIYGDLAQAIYSYRSINNWEDVNEEVFENKCKLLMMNRSYRTTIEITNNANNILNNLKLAEATPVIRHGVPVEFSESSNDIQYKINKIKEMQEKGYETIAIICKSDKEAKSLNKILNDKNIDSKYICDKDMEYSGGLFVITSAASKGLEFDGVIINDASNNIYDVSSDVDMHLLYVASTRALHELVILYNNKIVEVYEDELNKKLNTEKIKKL